MLVLPERNAVVPLLAANYRFAMYGSAYADPLRVLAKCNE
jgi:hypothetical protein